MKAIPKGLPLVAGGQARLGRNYRADGEFFIAFPHSKIAGFELVVCIYPMRAPVIIKNAVRVGLWAEEKRAILDIYLVSIFILDFVQAHGRIEAPGSKKIAEHLEADRSVDHRITPFEKGTEGNRSHPPHQLARANIRQPEYSQALTSNRTDTGAPFFTCMVWAAFPAGTKISKRDQLLKWAPI